jgi:hypothetical protein
VRIRFIVVKVSHKDMSVPYGMIVWLTCIISHFVTRDFMNEIR